MIPVNYGVWIPKQGWLKRNGEAFATDNRDIAAETARRVGQGAKVYFIDSALADLELYFIEMESSQVKGIRQLFSSWMKRIQGG